MQQILNVSPVLWAVPPATFSVPARPAALHTTSGLTANAIQPVSLATILRPPTILASPVLWAVPPAPLSVPARPAALHTTSGPTVYAT